MSDTEKKRTDAPERQALSRLEAVAERLIEERAAVADQAREAEDRVRELKTLLSEFPEGKVDMVILEKAITRLRDQNAELKGRMAEGREGVERILSRIRFLENQG